MKNKLTTKEHKTVIIDTAIFSLWITAVAFVAYSFDLLKYFE